MKKSFCIAFLMFSIHSFSQENTSWKHIGYVETIPAKRAAVYAFNPNYEGHACSLCSSELRILSENEAVFSITDGIIWSILSWGEEEQFVMIKDAQGLFYAYPSLKKIGVAKGDKIKIGTLLGTALAIENNSCHEFFLQVFNQEGQCLNEDFIWQSIRNADVIPITKL